MIQLSRFFERDGLTLEDERGETLAVMGHDSEKGLLLVAGRDGVLSWRPAAGLKVPLAADVTLEDFGESRSVEPEPEEPVDEPPGLLTTLVGVLAASPAVRQLARQALVTLAAVDRSEVPEGVVPCCPMCEQPLPPRFEDLEEIGRPATGAAVA